jgi:hypothetical protein
MKNIQKNHDNPNYYVLLVIFQAYKNVILRNVHSFGWFFWLCCYPKGMYVWNKRESRELGHVHGVNHERSTRLLNVIKAI